MDVDTTTLPLDSSESISSENNALPHCNAETSEAAAEDRLASTELATVTVSSNKSAAGVISLKEEVATVPSLGEKETTGPVVTQTNGFLVQGSGVQVVTPEQYAKMKAAVVLKQQRAVISASTASPRAAAAPMLIRPQGVSLPKTGAALVQATGVPAGITLQPGATVHRLTIAQLASLVRPGVPTVGAVVRSGAPTPVRIAIGGVPTVVQAAATPRTITPAVTAHLRPRGISITPRAATPVSQSHVISTLMTQGGVQKRVFLVANSSAGTATSVQGFVSVTTVDASSAALPSSSVVTSGTPLRTSIALVSSLGATIAAQSLAGSISAQTINNQLSPVVSAVATTMTATPSPGSLADIQQALGNTMKQQQLRAGSGQELRAALLGSPVQQRQVRATVVSAARPQIQLRTALVRGIAPQPQQPRTAAVVARQHLVPLRAATGGQQQLQQIRVAGMQTIRLSTPGQIMMTTRPGSGVGVIRGAVTLGSRVPSSSLGTLQLVNNSTRPGGAVAGLSGSSQTVYILTSRSAGLPGISTSATVATAQAGQMLRVITSSQGGAVPPGGVLQLIAQAGGLPGSMARITRLLPQPAKTGIAVPKIGSSAEGGSAAGRTKLIAGRGGAIPRSVQSIASLPNSSGGDQSQNQKKADRIVAEAIAKAKSGGLVLDPCTGELGPKRPPPRKLKRKLALEGETGDEGDEISSPVKVKRTPKPRPPRPKKMKLKKGEKGEDEEGKVDVVGDDEERGEGEDEDDLEFKINRKERPSMIRKKKRKTPKFLKKRMKKRLESESDASDIELKKLLPRVKKNKKYRKKGEIDSDPNFSQMGEEGVDTADGWGETEGVGENNLGGSIFDDSIYQPETRRSGRSVRKKYVDEIDLNLSGSSTDSADEDDEDGKIRRAVIGGANKNTPTASLTRNNSEIFTSEPAEEDAQIVEKIFGKRWAQRKPPPPPPIAVVPPAPKLMDNAMDVIMEDGCIDVNVEEVGGEVEEEIDLVSEPDKPTTIPTPVTDVVKPAAETKVEEYYVKYKNYSYLHCEWRTFEELAAGDKRIAMKIKRFNLKQPLYSLVNEVDELDLFNQEYVEVDRVLDVAVTPDPVTRETVTHYLVTWRSLPYEEATWELEEDVEREKIDAYLKIKDPPPPEQRGIKCRPTPREWKTIKESPVFKNNNTLREYQLEGLNWLSFSYYNKQNCILADEMGLGKTIQSISFLQLVYDYGIHGPFLVIVPLSTIGNWQREFESWTDLNVIIYHGSVHSRNMLRQYEMYFKDDKGKRVRNLYKFHVLITTYEVIITDFDELSQVDWRVAIIDEAHRLKNRNCKLLQGLTCFELEHRVLLTGTPLQNNVDELFSLLSFLEPKQFSSLDAFMTEFGKLETETQVDKLKALLKPMMLRRLKEDVEKSIAPKEETIVEVELTNIQKKYYRAILERNFSFLEKGGNSSSNLPNLVNTMMELRKCCNHPYLINGAEDQILSELKATRHDSAEKLCQAMIQASGKLVLVDKLLPKLKSDGHKVLIFSQMIRVLDIIEDYLMHKQYLYERIDGRKRGPVRQEAIDRFSKPDSDRFIFLLCTRAGGLGINLTAADTVIIFDSDWNPQNDLQAQARCHRIGQLKSVKVYRLITRNTYEREMFDRASLKLGLDKAVLQSTGSGKNKDVNGMGMPQQLSKKEIEDLLKKGAYGALMEEDQASEQFCEEDIDHILQRRTQVIQIESGVKGSTFAKASFNLSTNRSDIDIDDPNFWQKWAKKADFNVNDFQKKELIVDLPRQRKSTTRYGKQGSLINIDELDLSDKSDNENKLDQPNKSGQISQTPNGPGVKGRRSKGGKKRKRGRPVREEPPVEPVEPEPVKLKVYSRTDCFKVEKNLLVFGWGRWNDIMTHGRFKNRLKEEDIIIITRAMLMYSLDHYEGDDRIKKFIYDLISPTEDGLEKDYKNHTGLSAPVPRGRKCKKIKKDATLSSSSSSNKKFDEDLTKLDIDVDKILVDDNYKKHLTRQANKVLLRVRLLYYLRQEVIGSQAEKIFSGASASDIDVPILCADNDMPVYWWDTLADRCLLVGVFKHGYEKYNQMRQDPSLCFLARCGPPDNKALQAEQEDNDDDIKEEDEDDEAKVDGSKKDKKKKKNVNKDVDDDKNINKDVGDNKNVSKDMERNKKNKKDVEDDTAILGEDDSAASPQSKRTIITPSLAPMVVSENGKLPFPNTADLNTRFRRIITSYQRSHKQGMMKLEQVAKKMHRREQMKEGGGDSERRYIGPAELQNMNLEGVGSNPMLLAEQLHWTRREESEFYRVVSTYGVERDFRTGQFIWDTFRSLGRLDKKFDDTLTEYFKAFYHMCMKVCQRFNNEEEARPPNGLYVMPITEERANRCLARIDLLNKIREQILLHPCIDERLALCQASSYLPDWWICGRHDKDLLIGAARHGVCKTDEHIQYDPHLSFCAIAKYYAEMKAKEEEEEKAAKGVAEISCDATVIKKEEEGENVDHTDKNVTGSSTIKSELTNHVELHDSKELKSEVEAVDCTGTEKMAMKAIVEKKVSSSIGSEELKLDRKSVMIDAVDDLTPTSIEDEKVKKESSTGNNSETGISFANGGDGTSHESFGFSSGQQDVARDGNIGGGGSGTGVEGEGDEDEANPAVTSTSRWANQWPKDRVIFHRLENICQCVELGRWRLSRRHLLALQAATHMAAVSAAGGGFSEDGTPKPAGYDGSHGSGGGHDYSTMNPNDLMAQLDDVAMRMGLPKRRHRRIRGGGGAGEQESRSHPNDGAHLTNTTDSLNDTNNSAQQEGSGGQSQGSTPLVRKRRRHKQHHQPLVGGINDSPLIGEAESLDRVGMDSIRPVDNLPQTSQGLEPWFQAQRDLQYQNEISPGHKYHRRRPRLDPNKLSVAGLTGEERVAVINRHTGKKITGSKAPVLATLGAWLERNPGFDIDFKWTNVVKSFGSVGEQLNHRFQTASPGSTPSSSSQPWGTGASFKSSSANPQISQQLLPPNYTPWPNSPAIQAFNSLTDSRTSASRYCPLDLLSTVSNGGYMTNMSSVVATSQASIDPTCSQANDLSVAPSVDASGNGSTSITGIEQTAAIDEELSSSSGWAVANNCTDYELNAKLDSEAEAGVTTVSICADDGEGHIEEMIEIETEEELVTDDIIYETVHYSESMDYSLSNQNVSLSYSPSNQNAAFSYSMSNENFTSELDSTHEMSISNLNTESQFDVTAASVPESSEDEGDDEEVESNEEEEEEEEDD